MGVKYRIRSATLRNYLCKEISTSNLPRSKIPHEANMFNIQHLHTYRHKSTRSNLDALAWFQLMLLEIC